MAISLSLNRLPWYGQIGVFVAISLAATGAFWNFYAVPAQAAIDEQRAQLMTISAENARGQREASNLAAFRQKVASREAELARLSDYLPEEQDVADLLRRVQGMATQSRLAIRGFTPKGVTKQQLHAEWPIGLHLEGTYHDLGAFLERISKYPRIINVGNIKITARENQTASSTISAECTAMTFVLVDPKAAAAAGDTKTPADPARKTT